MDTCSLLSLYQCCLEDAVFTRQMANLSALTSFLQRQCLCDVLPLESDPNGCQMFREESGIHASFL